MTLLTRFSKEDKYPSAKAPERPAVHGLTSWLRKFTVTRSTPAGEADNSSVS